MVRNKGGFIVGALVGTVIGGVVALLAAPKSGKQLRDDISGELDNWIDRANDYTDYAVERGVEMYDVATGVAGEVGEDIKVNLKSTADQLKKSAEELKSHAEKEVANVSDNIQEAGKELEEKVEEVKEQVTTENN